ncbi:uncharacterized protein J3R85_003042 [Psidium guajava]|nr:uncharacterized protein J3R85_003042 [Psidium guajava]
MRIGAIGRNLVFSVTNTQSISKPHPIVMSNRQMSLGHPRYVIVGPIHIAVGLLVRSELYEVKYRSRMICDVYCCCACFRLDNVGSSSCVANGVGYCLAVALTGCFGACCCGCHNRTKMRMRFDWEKKPCNDCCLHIFCHCCALCQEYRHLQNLGYDPSKGWEEKGKIGNGSIGMTPPQRMAM